MKIVIALCVVLLTGCVAGDRMVRIVETGAAGQYIPFADAQVKGIRVETSSKKLQGSVNIQYIGADGSVVEYHSE